MRIASLELHDFRSFVHAGPIKLDQINVLIGPNNSGKTSILRALHLLQHGSSDPVPDIRVNAQVARVVMKVTGMRASNPLLGLPPGNSYDGGLVTAGLGPSTQFNLGFQGDGPEPAAFGLSIISDMEPDHFIIPYLSKRKPAYYQPEVSYENAMRIRPDLAHLAAKLSRLASPGFPEYERYIGTCKDILGFPVSSITTERGQLPGTYLPDRKAIFIEQMGEGVPNIVGLLAELALSKNKLFLIEEPENDLHPQALKALLDLIIESSEHNQFVISTHSNIVVRHLASAENSILYRVATKKGELPPVATITEVPRTVEARQQVLRELGYSFSDFDLWDGWLILEESSAERIIRDYLIPWFAPKLARVRTLAVGGIGNMKPTFDDFHRMVRFTHLEEVYRNSTWVRVDGDGVGKETVAALRKNYKTWEPDRFDVFSHGQFEHYYPAEFSQQIKDTLAIPDSDERREAKKLLLNDVRAWLDEDDERGKEALKESAKEIIEDLCSLEKQLLRT